MTDDEQRRLLYAQAQTAIAGDVPVVSLWYKTNVAVFQPDIHGVRLSPIVTLYAWPSELDLMARIAGLRLAERWGGWLDEPFTARSARHVSVYRA